MPDDQNTKKIEKFLNALSGDAITAQEFKKTFIAILKQVLKFEKKLMDKQAEISKDLDKKFGTLTKQMENKVSKIEKGKDGKDGYTPQKGVDYFDGRDGENGADGSPDKPNEVVKKVNQASDKIHQSQIDQLHEDLHKIREELYATQMTTQDNSQFFMKFAGDTVRTHDISSELDGSTKTFTLPVQGQILLVISSSFPSIFRPDIDYTVSGGNITFTDEISASSTLAEGQSVVILYSIP